MLVIEDSFAQWAGQALEAPHYYFVTLSAISVLVGGCIKVVRAAFSVLDDDDMPFFFAALIFFPTYFLMSVCGLVLL